MTNLSQMDQTKRPTMTPARKYVCEQLSRLGPGNVVNRDVVERWRGGYSQVTIMHQLLAISNGLVPGWEIARLRRGSYQIVEVGDPTTLELSHPGVGVHQRGKASNNGTAATATASTRSGKALKRGDVLEVIGATEKYGLLVHDQYDRIYTIQPL